MTDTSVTISQERFEELLAAHRASRGDDVNVPLNQIFLEQDAAAFRKIRSSRPQRNLLEDIKDADKWRALPDQLLSLIMGHESTHYAVICADIQTGRALREGKLAADAAKWSDLCKMCVGGTPVCADDVLKIIQAAELRAIQNELAAERWRRHGTFFEKIAHYWHADRTYEKIEDLLSDAELGALVRKMPVGASLMNAQMWEACPYQSRDAYKSFTPEAALKGAEDAGWLVMPMPYVQGCMTEEPK